MALMTCKCDQIEQEDHVQNGPSNVRAAVSA